MQHGQQEDSAVAAAEAAALRERSRKQEEAIQRLQRDAIEVAVELDVARAVRQPAGIFHQSFGGSPMVDRCA